MKAPVIRTGSLIYEQAVWACSRISALEVGRDHTMFPVCMKYLSDESAIEQTVTGC
jgi:hypothetical protein